MGESASGPGPSRTMIVLRLGKMIEMALVEHGLTENQYRALGFILDGDPDVSEMSFRLVMQRPNVTALLDGLVERGLVEKRRRSEDRRRVELALTDEGAALFEVASRSADEALQLLARLADGDHEDRLAAITAWGPSVEEAARQYRASRAGSP